MRIPEHNSAGSSIVLATPDYSNDHDNHHHKRRAAFGQYLGAPTASLYPTTPGGFLPTRFGSTSSAITSSVDINMLTPSPQFERFSNDNLNNHFDFSDAQFENVTHMLDDYEYLTPQDAVWPSHYPAQPAASWEPPAVPQRQAGHSKQNWPLNPPSTAPSTKVYDHKKYGGADSASHSNEQEDERSTLKENDDTRMNVDIIAPHAVWQMSSPTANDSERGVPNQTGWSSSANAAAEGAGAFGESNSVSDGQAIFLQFEGPKDSEQQTSTTLSSADFDENLLEIVSSPSEDAHTPKSAVATDTERGELGGKSEDNYQHVEAAGPSSPDESVDSLSTLVEVQPRAVDDDVARLSNLFDSSSFPGKSLKNSSKNGSQKKRLAHGSISSYAFRQKRGGAKPVPSSLISKPISAEPINSYSDFVAVPSVMPPPPLPPPPPTQQMIDNFAKIQRAATLRRLAARSAEFRGEADRLAGEITAAAPLETRAAALADLGATLAAARQDCDAEARAVAAATGRLDRATAELDAAAAATRSRVQRALLLAGDAARSRSLVADETRRGAVLAGLVASRERRRAWCERHLRIADLVRDAVADRVAIEAAARAAEDDMAEMRELLADERALRDAVAALSVEVDRLKDEHRAAKTVWEAECAAATDARGAGGVGFASGKTGGRRDIESEGEADGDGDGEGEGEGVSDEEVDDFFTYEHYGWTEGGASGGGDYGEDSGSD
ncbi:hypothetical protein DFJ73DRAFT_911155 [Zopfochytrium polystomum]|nr:hypothetical protein DFJ73DRAFT_911155 [Zopfochytrium polystomum]